MRPLERNTYHESCSGIQTMNSLILGKVRSQCYITATIVYSKHIEHFKVRTILSSIFNFFGLPMMQESKSNLTFGSEYFDQCAKSIL